MDLDWIDVAIIVVRAVLGWALWLVATALLIWGERRLVAKMQTRLGPNRLGPFGILQVLADGAKMFFKEDITPSRIDRVVYFAAPIVSAIVAMVTFAVIPFGGTWVTELGGETREIALQIWDPEIGMLWFLAMSSIGVYGIALGGWASGSKYPLLGGVRSTAQMISYELALGLSLAAVFVFNGTLQVSRIVEIQSGTFFPDSFFSWFPAWNVFPMSVAAVIFFIAVVAEAQRPPFDLPEAEGELVAGFHTEYSGAKFAMFMLSEFMAVITMSAITVTLFFGGPDPIIPSPFIANSFWDALWGFGAFATKVFVFVFVFVWLRGTLPRLRYDRLMDLGWKVMLPLSLLWVLATGAVVTVNNEETGATLYVVLGALVGAALVLALVAPLFDRRAPGGPGEGGGGGGPRAVAPDGDGGGGQALEPGPVSGPPEAEPEGTAVGERSGSRRAPETVDATAATASAPRARS